MSVVLCTKFRRSLASATKDIGVMNYRFVFSLFHRTVDTSDLVDRSQNLALWLRGEPSTIYQQNLLNKVIA